MQGDGVPGNLSSSSALCSATDWVVALLTGSLALSVATLAIAAIGFLMLSGRAPIGRTGRVIVGCFILFSAPVIGRALAALQHDQEPTESLPGAAVPAAPTYQPTVPRFEQKDPYAGAAVPPPEKDILQ